MKLKMRSLKAAKKRLFPTISGTVKRWHANTSHLKAKKTTKRKRHLKKSTFLSKSDLKRIKSRL